MLSQHLAQTTDDNYTKPKNTDDTVKNRSASHDTAVGGSIMGTDKASTHHLSRRSISLGFGLFIFLVLLFLSPLLPGKVLRNSAGSSGSFSIDGASSISCEGNLGQVKNIINYTSKKGFPLTYGYSATFAISADCNGVTQTKKGGQSSEFNSVAVVADVACVAVVALILTKLIRKFTK